jgi:4-hydroxy-tetrahydrodipicolinate reductase
MKLGISGITGKTGSFVFRAAQKDPTFTSIQGFARDSMRFSCASCAESLHHLVASCDVIIDFSSPSMTSDLILFARKERKPLVIGTTGLSDHTHRLLSEAASDIAIIYAANFSIGVTAFLQAATLLSEKLYRHFQMKIEETHHIHKKDSPSGTALAIAKATGHNPSIESFRIAEEIGQHQLIFSNPFEKIELSHQALSREVFAEGALFAAKTLVLQPPGLYSLKDFLT